MGIGQGVEYWVQSVMNGKYLNNPPVTETEMQKGDAKAKSAEK